MRVILRADVENLGHLGDVVTVKPGYGRNFLIPYGMAMPATSSNLKVFELERKKLQAKMDAMRSEAGLMAAKLEGLLITISMRVGENDKLYGSVTNAIIGDALAELGLVIDRRRILLDVPIRTLGVHEVRVRLHPDVIPSFTVKVISQDKTLAGEQTQVVAKEVPAEETAAANMNAASDQAPEDAE